MHRNCLQSFFAPRRTLQVGEKTIYQLNTSISVPVVAKLATREKIWYVIIINEKDKIRTQKNLSPNLLSVAFQVLRCYDSRVRQTNRSPEIYMSNTVGEAEIVFEGGAKIDSVDGEKHSNKNDEFFSLSRQNKILIIAVPYRKVNIMPHLPCSSFLLSINSRNFTWTVLLMAILEPSTRCLEMKIMAGSLTTISGGELTKGAIRVDIINFFRMDID